MKLTYAQRTWIVNRSNIHGQMACPGRNGFVKASWLKTMKNLQKRGLAAPNAHGEYQLTSRGEAYKEGAIAAEIVWQGDKFLTIGSSQKFIDRVIECVSDVIGPNVHYPEDVKAAATAHWADLRAKRVFPQPHRKLPRHEKVRG